MITFDEILPVLEEVLSSHVEVVSQLKRLVVNRDLNGRIRLIVPEAAMQDTELVERLQNIAETLAERLKPHAFAPDQMLLYEPEMDEALVGAHSFPLEGMDNVFFADRLANEGGWAQIAEVSLGVPRVVFFSIKGGVGRSTALAVSAWSLAQAGKRVMVLDLDLESPGLSSGLLPPERRPAYGITDWLVEDLVDNGEALIADMVATSELAHDGEIYVIPAHGSGPGDYISKLGRVWMPKVLQGKRENWSQRLSRLLGRLEADYRPDVILIDSRSGIDEVASSCVTDLGATLVLLFAIDGEQTWSGYHILFQYWHQAGVARNIRERLQLVGAMLPETNAEDYFVGLRERSWDLFSEALYDVVPPGEAAGALWNFDDADETAPHYPWPIKWHRSFAALASLHDRLAKIDPHEAELLYGMLLRGLDDMVSVGEEEG